MTDPRRAKLDSLADSTEKLRRHNDNVAATQSGIVDSRAVLITKLRGQLAWALSLIEHEVPCPDCREYIARCCCPRTRTFARNYDDSRRLVDS